MNYFLVWGPFFTIVITLAKAFIDHNKWADGIKVNHPREWRYMAVAAIVPAAFFGMADSGLSSILQIGVAFKTLQFWLSFFASGPMMAFFIWLAFDGLYNKLRGFNWWFTGSNDPDDANTDNFLQKLKLWQHVAIKLGGLAISIIIYILTIR